MDGLQRQPDCDRDDVNFCAKEDTSQDDKPTRVYTRDGIIVRVYSGRQAITSDSEDDCPMTGGIFPNRLHEKLGFCNYCRPQDKSNIKTSTSGGCEFTGLILDDPHNRWCKPCRAFQEETDKQRKATKASTYQEEAEEDPGTSNEDVHSTSSDSNIEEDCKSTSADANTFEEDCTPSTSQRQQQDCDTSGDSEEEVGREVWKNTTESRPEAVPNECPICGQYFSRKYERDRHMKEVHSGEPSFKCLDCNKVFIREWILTRHKETAHSSHPPLYKCDICDKMFTQPGTRTRHKIEVHAGSCFKCNECPATFARKEGLLKHIKSGVHYIEYYCKCCKQNIIFKSLKSMESHYREIPKQGGRYYLTSCKNNPYPQRSSKYRIGNCPTVKGRMKGYTIKRK